MLLRRFCRLQPTFLARRFCSTSIATDCSDNPSTLSGRYGALVIGGGHNGLVCAAYLARAGKSVAVLERRHVLGGAAVTEEIVPGFRFSRASYLLSLFRPRIIEELELQKHGLRWHIKNPSSFTPMRGDKRSLLLGSDMRQNQEQIAQFSTKDAQMYPKYEELMERITVHLEQLMDVPPPDFDASKWSLAQQLYSLYSLVQPLGVRDGLELYELLTAPISKVMRRWFESEPLRATLATDAVIGFMAGPHSAATGYVLLHHVMGGVGGQRGAWAFAIGGMGAVSDACAKAAKLAGAELFVNAEVESVLTDSENRARGVRLRSGQEIEAGMVFSNSTPKVTFESLVEQALLPAQFVSDVANIDYTSPVTKINVALSSLPNFECSPNTGSTPLPHHQTTVHLNCEHMDVVQAAYMDACAGRVSRRPVIEMTIPSSVDNTLCASGSHVALLFTQYTPFSPVDQVEWDDNATESYAKRVFSQIDEYCPGFEKSVVGYEVLSPPALEQLFGLTGGNIFHGSMSMDQLFWSRPVRGFANYRTPIPGLYLCGSGAHPGLWDFGGCSEVFSIDYF